MSDDPITRLNEALEVYDLYLSEDPLDVEEIVTRTNRLLDPKLLPDRRLAARALAERYSWDHHFDRIVEIYREVLAEKRGESAR